MMRSEAAPVNYLYPLMLYGSGDPATDRLLTALKASGVPFVFRDLRDPDRVALAFMLKHEHSTVPQLYDCANHHIGDAEQALHWLAQT